MQGIAERGGAMKKKTVHPQSGMDCLNLKISALRTVVHDVRL